MRHDRRRMLLAAALAPVSLTVMERLLAMARKPVIQGIRELDGEVVVDGAAAEVGREIAPGETVATGPGARVVYVVGHSVFLQRGESRVKVGSLPEAAREQDGNIVVHTLRILAGKLLSVHARNELTATTPHAVIGIRGTGFYVDVQKDRTYACVCYGTADLMTAEGEALETVRTRHHESPRYLYPAGAERRIEPAEVRDHTDDELILLESLAHREPPFVDDAERSY